MNGQHFDTLTRSMSGATSRRAALGLAAVLGLGAVLPGEAKSKKEEAQGVTAAAVRGVPGRLRHEGLRAEQLSGPELW